MRVITLHNHDNLRARMLTVFESVKAALIGGAVEIVIRRPSKSREQEKKYHAMIGDIAESVMIDGRQYDEDVWKAKLLDGFNHEMKQQGTPLTRPGRVTMSLDGRRYITVRPSSAKFRKDEGSQFIEYLYATGTELGARWNEPALQYYQEVAGRLTA